MLGEVIKTNEAGYGFLRVPNHEEDIFFHATVLPGGYAEFNNVLGRWFEFETQDYKGRPRAYGMRPAE